MFAFLVKRPDLTMDEFIEYYETKHVPLVNQLTGIENQPVVYRRRYIRHDRADRVVVKATVDYRGNTLGSSIDSGKTLAELVATTGRDPASVDFDAVTEVGFSDEQAANRWLQALAKHSQMIVADEERFLWRERMRAVVIEEYSSFE
jgi:hypothetical protein